MSTITFTQTLDAKERIRQCLQIGPITKVENMLLALYACQTADEQNAAETHELNGVGFNATDAEFLSSLAEQVQMWRAGRGGYYREALSAKQQIALRKALRKYAGQLASLAPKPEAPKPVGPPPGLPLDSAAGAHFTTDQLSAAIHAYRPFLYAPIRGGGN